MDDGLFIDCHCHIAPDRSVVGPDGRAYPTPDEVLAALDHLNISRAVLLPGVSPECRVRFVSTEEILKIVASHPERFIPFCNLDPRMLSNAPDADFSRLLIYYREVGCRSLGEITANLPFDHPLVWNLFEHCQEAGMPVLFHIGPRLGGCYGLMDDLHLPRLEASLKRFPRLVFIGHSQPFWAELGPDVTEENRNGYPEGEVRPGGRVPELFQRYPNLFADLSARSGFNAISRDPDFGCAFLERFQDRLLFGTDIATSPVGHPPLPEYLRRLRDEGRISQEAFEKISFRNAQRLFRLEPS